MNNKFLALIACLTLASQAGAQVNFDKGINVKDVIETAKSSDIKAPYPNHGSQRRRVTRDCENFSYGPSDSQLSSGRVFLESTEYIEECRFVPKPPPPPPPPPPNNGGHNGGNNNGGHNPPPPPPGGGHNGGPGGNHGGPGGHKDFHGGPGDYYGNEYTYNDPNGTWYCRERVGQVFRASAQMNLAPRKLYAWERESFDVCMEGPRVDFNVRQSPYSYGVDRQGLYDLTFNLTPNYRVPTAPDADGLYLGSFTYADGKFHLVVNDRWGGEYAGEKTQIHVELIKDGFLFFNSSKGSKDFTFDAASGYEAVFAENELSKDKAFDPELDALEKSDRGPKKYFVKWGFRRIGSISTNDYIKKGDTDKIPG